MSESFVPGLSSRPAKWKYETAKEGQAALAELEARLGLPATAATIYNVPNLNRRIADLEKIALAVGRAYGSTPEKPLVYATPKRATATPAAPVATTATPSLSVPGELPLEKLRELGVNLFHLPTTASRAKIEERIRFEGLQIQGVSPARHVVKRSGLDLAIQNRRQATADKFLKVK